MFAQNIKKLRKQYGYTQTQMAEKLGVAKTTYASYEQDRRTPDANIQKKIADIFETSLDALHGREKLNNVKVESLFFNHIEGLNELPKEEQDRIIQNLLEQGAFLVERSKRNKK
ncbi:XRE family transcriptional regulator [Macrococcoides caseolyticum]|uniref:XRE family transcriptional regulator n=2 Tax=Staphylococcaceae TaxID=90964 RepID=A0A855GM93_9STAP|nr:MULTISPECIES: helix-turn-helix transcriptional regulator [Macrococcus]MDJ1110670.1 helix-turn-helix transcriptional regulator [Macrococcus sp. S115]PKE27114.1 XRE family transcriptional regulator [Macrococcus caseolyticus]PKE59663.1 XRE family transcriptional regulator [Macrococcus caseolyticus]PKE71104.1 XRE family transcriptional regulator [Macrococcus caseolyticus]TDM31210.1 XRE family transcriptional regulator [Macrococcus caseolyticus]